MQNRHVDLRERNAWEETVRQIRLTPKQLAVLTFLRDFTAENGFAPTLDEIADHLQVGKVTIHGHLAELEKKGAIEREPRMARSISVLHYPEAGRSSVPAPPRTPSPRPTGRLPIAGTVAAGGLTEAIEDPEEFDLEDLMPGDRELFMLRVKGDSMIEDHIQEGDLVLVERRNHARNGEIVVAAADDGQDATLKRFYKENGHFRLQPSNASMRPILVDHVDIRGVVTAVIRRLR